MVALVANLAMINVVIAVSGMWLRRDVKAAYVFIRVFLKEKGLGGLDPRERDGMASEYLHACNIL